MGKSTGKPDCERSRRFTYLRTYMLAGEEKKEQSIMHEAEQAVALHGVRMLTYLHAGISTKINRHFIAHGLTD